MPVELREICYSYARRSVLRDLNLVVEDGEWLAIVGATGSGRSTLAGILAGLRRPQRGHVLVDGHDIWTRRGRMQRHRLGLVMQRAEDQFVGSTVYEDIAFGPQCQGLSPSDTEPVVCAALSAMGFELEEVRDRAPQDFSGGQRKRLALAAILTLDPSVLVLDEPFVGLDVMARADLCVLLSGLRASKGITVVSLTSYLDQIGDAHRLALIVDGRVGLTGDMRDLVANQLSLREAGVSLPEQLQLALALRERGWNVPLLSRKGMLEAAIAREWNTQAHA